MYDTLQGCRVFKSFDRVALFLHICMDLIAGVCPLKMDELFFSVIYLRAVFTSLAEIRVQAAGGDYRASTTTGRHNNWPGESTGSFFFF